MDDSLRTSGSDEFADCFGVSDLHSGTEVCSRGEYTLEEADTGITPVQQHEISISHEAQVLACHPALAPGQRLEQSVDDDTVQDIHADGCPGLRGTFLARTFGIGAESRTDGRDFRKRQSGAVNRQNAQTAGTFEFHAGVIGEGSCLMQQFSEGGWLQVGTRFGDRAFPDAARRIGVELFEERLGLAPNAAEGKAGEERDKTREGELGGAVKSGRVGPKFVSETLAVYDFTGILKKVGERNLSCPVMLSIRSSGFSLIFFAFPGFQVPFVQATQNEPPHVVSIVSTSLISS